MLKLSTVENGCLHSKITVALRSFAFCFLGFGGRVNTSSITAVSLACGVMHCMFLMCVCERGGCKKESASSRLCEHKYLGLYPECRSLW